MRQKRTDAAACIARSLAQEHGETLSEMALGWLLSHKEVTSVLIGASKPSQILDNAKAIQCAPFTEEELRRIEEISVEQP
ncbi:MAG: aldo/keto reductase [Lachnospiraceae bacterium]|nr:aldo/keto reductase [Lachnospiraceae bacterium]